MLTRSLSVRNAILGSALMAFSATAFAAFPGYGGGIPVPGPNAA